MSQDTKCLVVAGPSGVGKSTLIKQALDQNNNWRFSVSATTRPKRDGEVDGREYYFLSRNEFETRIATGGMLEYAEVYGNLYGTPASEIDRAAADKLNLLIEVDTVGCLTIRALRPTFPLVAILPPSLHELKRRLRDRGTETEESLKLRFANIVAELQRMRGFDYAVVNDQLEIACKQLLAIMHITERGLLEVTPQVDRLLQQPEVRQ